MVRLDDRLALAALRGVLGELEGDPDGAGEVLRRVLGGRDVKPDNALPVREVKPQNTTRPAARQRVKARRPAPAAAPAPPPQPEGARLVAQLERAHGDLAAVAERFGFNRELLRRWKTGATGCSPSTLARLRAAVASPPTEPAAGQEAEAGEEPAPQGADHDAT
jgi:hypothetical protein